MKTILGYLFIAVLVVTVVAAVLLFTPLGERPLTALFSASDFEAVDFEDLSLRTSRTNSCCVRLASAPGTLTAWCSMSLWINCASVGAKLLPYSRVWNS